MRVVLAILLAVLAGAAPAQPAYPTKPIRLIVGYGAGGTADVVARTVAQRLSASLGQPVIIENKPGAGQVLAAETVARAEPDGQTLYLMTIGNATSAALMNALPYDMLSDFAPVASFGFFDLVLVANKGSSLNTIADVLASAKAAPDKLNVGTPALGSGQHLAAELFKRQSGLPLAIVPFSTTPAMVGAVKSNDVQVAFEILVPVYSMIKAGELKALAVTSGKHFPGLPEVPTFAEGGMPNYQVTSWNGLAAPAKTPRVVIDKLNAAVNAALASPDVAQKLQALGVTIQGGTPEAFRALWASEVARWASVVSAAGIPKQ